MATLDLFSMLAATSTPEKIAALRADHKPTVSRKRKLSARPARDTRAERHIPNEQHPFIPLQPRAPAIPTLRCVGPDQQIPHAERKRSERLTEDLEDMRAHLQAERARSFFLTSLITVSSYHDNQTGELL